VALHWPATHGRASNIAALPHYRIATLALLLPVRQPSPKPFKRTVGEIAQPDIAEDDLENPDRKNHIVGFIPLKPTIISKHIEYQKADHLLHEII
jgi:hypothetical protein